MGKAIKRSASWTVLYSSKQSKDSEANLKLSSSTPTKQTCLPQKSSNLITNLSSPIPSNNQFDVFCNKTFLSSPTNSPYNYCHIEQPSFTPHQLTNPFHFNSLNFTSFNNFPNIFADSNTNSELANQGFSFQNNSFFSEQQKLLNHTNVSFAGYSAPNPVVYPSDSSFLKHKPSCPPIVLNMSPILLLPENFPPYPVQPQIPSQIIPQHLPSQPSTPSFPKQTCPSEKFFSSDQAPTSNIKQFIKLANMHEALLQTGPTQDMSGELKTVLAYRYNLQEQFI